MDTTLPRPNPFAIPSGTFVRFILLIAVSSVAALASLSQDTAVMLGVHADEVITYQQCVARAQHAAVTQRQINELLLQHCYDPRSDVGLWPDVIALGLFWFVALVAYWCLPRWRIRRRRLRPLTTDQFPELTKYLGDLHREIGIREHVIYLLEPLNPKVSGLAFGRFGRRYIMLSGGLVALFARDKQAFRMVVLHELAHVHNRDLDITFITIVVWRLVAFLLARNILGISINVSSGRWQGFGIPSGVAETAEIIVLALSVPLIRNAVLRSRELYADARITQWGGSSSGFLRLFDAYSRHGMGRFGGLLRVHPRLKERDKALTDAQNLFAISFWEMLAVGMMVILTREEISNLMAHPTGPFVAEGVGTLFAAPLLALGIGFPIWREAIRSFVSQAPMVIKRAGLGLGIGFTIGAAITPDVFLLHTTQTSLSGLLVTIIPSLLLLFLSGFFVVRWIALVACSWLPVIVNRDRPIPVIIGTLIAMSIPLAIWLYVISWLPVTTVYVRTFVYPYPRAAMILAIAASAGTAVVPLLLALALIPVVGHAWGYHSRRTTRL